MGNAKQRDTGDAKRGIRERISGRLNHFADGEAGSVFWAGRRSVEWAHETVTAINELNASRRAQKNLEASRDEWEREDANSAYVLVQDELRSRRSNS